MGGVGAWARGRVGGVGGVGGVVGGGRVGGVGEGAGGRGDGWAGGSRCERSERRDGSAYLPSHLRATYTFGPPQAPIFLHFSSKILSFC